MSETNFTQTGGNIYGDMAPLSEKGSFSSTYEPTKPRHNLIVNAAAAISVALALSACGSQAPVTACETPNVPVDEMGWEFTPGGTSKEGEVQIPGFIASVINVGTYKQPQSAPNILVAEVILDPTLLTADSVKYEIYPSNAELYQGLVENRLLHGAYGMQFYAVLATGCSREQTQRAKEQVEDNPNSDASVLAMFPFAIEQ